MTKFAAALLSAALMAPAAAQAGTAIQGFGADTAFGVPADELSGLTPAGFDAAGPFGDQTADAATPGSGPLRYTLVTPVELASGEHYAGPVVDDGAVASVLGLAGATGDVAPGTDIASHFSLPDTVAAASGVPLNGKFSFRGIASRLPEPATWALMIMGFGAIGGALRFHIRRSEARFTAKLRRIAAGETR